MQVYVNKEGDSEGPQRTLRAYRRVIVPAGKNIKVEIPLPRNTFEWWDTATNTMRILPGRYNVMVGPSANPADLKSVAVTVR